MTHEFVYSQDLPLIRDGMPVDAATANSALEVVGLNMDLIWEMLQKNLSRQALILQNQKLAENLTVGTIVYFKKPESSSSEGCFAPALAAVTSPATTWDFSVSDANAYVWGMLIAVHDNQLGDILINGIADVDLGSAFDNGTPSVGLVYLSATQPGKITVQPQPITFPVGYVSEQVAAQKYRVFVSVRFNDLLTGHKHYRVPIAAVPSGSTISASPCIISPINRSITGWLPANDASFGGLAPPEAKYGYNMPVGLKEIWPAVPLNTAILSWARSSDLPDSTPLVGGVPQEFCRLDANGIWWMKNTATYLPWDSTRDYVAGVPVGFDAEVAPDMTLWFTKPEHNTADDGVISLRTVENSSLSLTSRESGLPATSGNLVLDLDLRLAQGDTNAGGPLAVKSFSGNRYHLGPVVSGISVDEEGFFVSGDGVTNAFAWGDVSITGPNGFRGRELPFDTIWLNPARDNIYQGNPGIAFDAGRRSSMIGQVVLPAWRTSSFPAGLGIGVVMYVMCPVAGAVGPQTFQVRYNSVGRPAQKLTMYPVADNNGGNINFTNLPLQMTNPISTNNSLSFPQYFQVFSQRVPVSPGMLFNFEISRQINDGYPGSLVLIKCAGIIDTLDE